tara:strand:+ start:137 stop:310 length:174 start_codon:yes stop_codon:yes gene_type:complete
MTENEIKIKTASTFLVRGDFEQIELFNALVEKFSKVPFSVTILSKVCLKNEIERGEE